MATMRVARCANLVNCCRLGQPDTSTTASHQGGYWSLTAGHVTQRDGSLPEHRKLLQPPAHFSISATYSSAPNTSSPNPGSMAMYFATCTAGRKFSTFGVLL